MYAPTGMSFSRFSLRSSSSCPELPSAGSLRMEERRVVRIDRSGHRTNRRYAFRTQDMLSRTEDMVFGPKICFSEPKIIYKRVYKWIYLIWSLRLVSRATHIRANATPNLSLRTWRAARKQARACTCVFTYKNACS